MLTTMESDYPSEVSIHFPNMKAFVQKWTIFQFLKMNVFNNVFKFQCSLLTWRVISSFSNKKEVVSTSSSLSTQTLSSWIEAFTKMSAYLLICGDMYWRIIFSFLDFIMENVMLDFKCTLVWNTVKASSRSKQ
jgi:hypothetical protein